MIEGFDEDVAEELRARARNYLEQRDRELNERRVELGVEDEMATIEGLNAAMVVTLGENGIKTRDDLADLAADELQELFEGPAALSEDAANAIIMAARAHWFADDPAPEAEAGEQTETAPTA